MPSAFARATAIIAALVLPRNTARKIVCFLAALLLVFATSTFRFHGKRHISFLRQTIFRRRKGLSVRRPPDTTTHHERVQPPHTFYITVWEHERRNIVLVGFYDKFAQSPEHRDIISRTLATGFLRKLAHTISNTDHRIRC